MEAHEGGPPRRAARRLPSRVRQAAAAQAAAAQAAAAQAAAAQAAAAQAARDAAAASAGAPVRETGALASATATEPPGTGADAAGAGSAQGVGRVVEPGGETGPGTGPRPQADRSVERLVFFSDAVIAIAMTLLVIDLRLPGSGSSTTDSDLRVALWALAPRFFSFALSVAVIALWWSGHNRLFRHVRRLDPRMLALNFVILGAIAFLPFATSVLGGYGNLPSAVVVYAATNALVAFAFVELRIHAAGAGLVEPGSDDAAFEARTRVTLGTGLIFTVSMGIALVSPFTAMVSWNLIWIGPRIVPTARQLRDELRSRE